MIQLKNNLSLNRRDDNSYIIIDPEQGKYYKLNNSALQIIDRLKKKKTIESLITDISDHYGVPTSLVREDIEKFVEKLKLSGFIYEEDNVKDIDKSDDTNKESLEELKTLWIKVTNKCNLSCHYCYAESGVNAENTDEITLEEIEKLLETAKPMGLERIVITGGEPLIRKDILEIFKLARKFGLVQLLSNGTIYDEKILKQIVEFVDIIQFSMDSHEKEKHDEIRGVGSFEKTLKSVKYLRSIGFKNIVFAATPTPTNNIDLRKMIDLCITNEVRRLHVNRYVPLGRAKDYKKFDIEEFYRKADEAYFYISQLYRKSLESKESFDFAIDISGDLVESVAAVNKKYSCGLNKSSASIESNGDVYLCQAMHHKSLVIGNIRNESFDSIMKKSREKFGEFNVDSIDKCKDCDVRYWCAGGCRALAFAVNGEMRKEDPQCCSHRQRVLEIMGRVGT